LNFLTDDGVPSGITSGLCGKCDADVKLKVGCIFKLKSESPTTRRAGGLDFSAIGGKKQRHASALIGAGGTGCKAPGLKIPNQ